MKKILIKIDEFPRDSETFIIHHVIILIQMGYDVYILCSRIFPFDQSLHGEILAKYNIKDKIIIYNNANFSRVKYINILAIILRNLNSYKPIFKMLIMRLFNTRNIQYLDYYKRLLNFDVIHIQYGTNHKPIDFLKTIGIIKSKIIVTFHGHDAFFPINGIIKDKGYYKNIIEHAELFTVNTNYLFNQLIKLGFPQDKLAIIPAPVNTEVFYPREKEPNSVINILCVGRLETIKGFDYVIKCLKILKDNNLLFRFKLIGNGTKKESLEKLVYDLGLDDCVEFSPFLPHEVLREEYWKADIFVMSSITVRRKIKETQGLVTLEAQACGTPVVAFNSGGIGYTLENGKTGLLCKEMDYLDLASKLEYLISNPEIRIRMGERAPSFVEQHYSEKSVKMQWQNLLNEL